MEKVILIRFGEIYLKGKNRGYFERVLLENINAALKKFNLTATKIPGRFLISGYDESIQGDIIDAVSKVSGIFSFSPAILVESDIDKIEEVSVLLMSQKCGTFKVETNRADKKRITMRSMEVSAKIGEAILNNNKNLKVDVSSPEITLKIDIRENNKTLISCENIRGVGGMPVGTSSSGLILLSGGIDSPVAAFMMAKRGVKVSAVHFHSYPYTSIGAREKVEELAKLLVPYTGNMTIYMVSMTELQEQIHKNCDDSYMITLLRRGMFTVAEKLAIKYKKKMLITGENLGQVASQTIESMTVVSDVLKSGIQVIRPLVAFDKYEIIDIAKKIGTFDVSIRPFEDCCTVFLPESPIIKPELYLTLKEQEKIDFDNIIKRALDSVEIVHIDENGVVG